MTKVRVQLCFKRGTCASLVNLFVCLAAKMEMMLLRGASVVLLVKL